MATQLKSLKIDRVDLVPEGANSAAFITLFKGKEGKSMDVDEILAKMKPEHASVLNAKLEALKKAKEEAENEANKAKDEADKAKDEADKAKAEADAAKQEAKKAKDTSKNPFGANSKPSDTDDDEGDPDDEKDDEKDDKKDVGKATGKKGDGGTVSFDEDETLLKSLPEELQGYVSMMRKQKEAAEEVAKAAIAREKHAEAVSKAADLKALPVANDELVAFIEKAAPETVSMLESIAKAIDHTVLSESGSNEPGSFSKSANQAWDVIEEKAATIAKERNITKAKGITAVIDEYPELYRAYLEGGAN